MPRIAGSLLEWRALAVVMESGSSGVPVGQLGRRLGVATSGASRVVARLERRGLVTLRRGVTDRRTALVHPTLEGRQLWTTIVERRRALIRAALAAAEPIVQPVATDVIEALVARVRLGGLNACDLGGSAGRSSRADPPAADGRSA